MDNEQDQKQGQPPIPIDDPQIDPQQIMKDISAQLAHARDEALVRRGPEPIYKPGSYPEKPDDIPYDPHFYQFMDELKKGQIKTSTELDIRESAIGRLPLIGGIWKRLQISFHGPALFYANRVADRQAAINTQFFEAISKLVAANQEQQREILRLREALNQQLDTDQ